MHQFSENLIWGTAKIAAYLGLKFNNQAVRLLERGEIQNARKLGGRWAASRPDLDAYLAKTRKKAA